MMRTSFVAVESNNNKKEVVGYVWWTATGASLPEGQVKCIIVHGDHRRHGVATALLQAVAKKLKERKCIRWRLHVRPENQPAVMLYQKLGMQRLCGAAEVSLTWNCVSQLPSGAEEGTPVCLPVVSSEEEAVLESAFGLCPGVFCEARELGGRIPLQLRSSGGDNELLGCCIFDPAFPGAYPFCVTRPAFARTLLDEMQKHHDEARDDFFLLIEKQEALTDALVAASAEVMFRMDCYSGSLP